MIADADSDVRLAKGKFWESCKDGTRKEICDSFGWKYKVMQEYALYAKEIPVSTGISYTHWNSARMAGALKDERPALLENLVKTLRSGRKNMLENNNEG